jgi:DNA modification methylase
MRDNRIFIAGIVFLVLLMIGQTIIKGYKSQLIQLSKNMEHSEVKRNQLDLALRDQIIFNGQKIDDWSLVNKNGRIIKISDFSTIKGCIFFMFSEYSCFDCVRESLNEVLNAIKVNQRLVIICGFSNIHQALNWATENGFNGEIYIFKDYSRCIFSKSSNYPYLFRLNENMQLLNVYTFIPDIMYLKLYIDVL